jgi:membrane-associated phospholipid phosphatase
MITHERIRQKLTALDSNHSRYERLAHLVSNVLNPPLVSVFGIVLMAEFIDTRQAWIWALAFTLIAVLLPTGYVYYLLNQGKIETFHIPNRGNRKKPYVVIIASNVLGVLLMLIFDAPDLLIAFGVMGVVLSGLLFLINSYWKISGHSTAISSLSVFFVATLGWSALPTLVMIPLVAWARIKTHSHTLWQTVAGTMVGAGFILVTWFLLQSLPG